MPIYEYECRSCSHVFDVLQKMSDARLSDCPECGQPELKKRVSAPNFRLKGAGWYETDFKDKNKRNLADGSGSDGSKADTKTADGEKSGSAKSESTPSETKKGASDSAGKSSSKSSTKSSSGSSGGAGSAAD